MVISSDLKNRLNTRTGWFAGTVMITVSVIIALILAELAIRFFFPQRLYYNVSQWDPDVGFTIIPNIQSVQRNYEYEMTIRINSRGLRDREFPFEKPPRTIRIGVFGDSFTFGEGVESEQTFVKLLEQYFIKDPRLATLGWRVEVLNFGIGKTGTSHQLAWYRKEGVRYLLDIVVLAFYAENDFNGNICGVYHLSGGELVHDPTAYSSIRRIQSVVYSIPGYRWLAEHSHLVNIARVVATNLDDRRRLASGGEVLQPSSTENGLYAVELTKSLVEAFKVESNRNGSKFIMLIFPARGQKPIEEYKNNKPLDSYLVWLSLLEDFLNSSRLDWIDFVPIFARLPAKTNYYEVDGHWRPAGHELVARHLFHWLKDDVYRMIKERDDLLPSNRSEIW